MRVAFVTPEALPFSKTGGLADVARSLPDALSRSGAETAVFTPFYRSAQEWYKQHTPRAELIELPPLWIGREQHVPRFRIIDGTPKHVLVVNDFLYTRGHPYLDADGQDYADNVARYAFLCRSVLEYYLQHERAPDLFHLHDWQTALLAVYLRTTYSLPQFAETRSLLTIHNVGYPGIFPAEQIYATGLNWDVFTPEILEYYGKLNLLKGGIVLADAINTVSPTYAEEIQTHAYGRGLDGVLRAQAHKLEGILNGIDTVQWNPATDPHLPERYSISRLSGKKICKRQLQRELGLPLRANALLMGTISRLDHQKGLPLLIKAFPRIADLDVQLVSLGSGDSALAEELRQLSVQYPKQVAVKLGHDESLAHRIVAGCDVFLMPSRYEPCGLTQMYSQRYGTVPVVRNTGGLRDTVTNYTAARLAAGKASGITFGAYDAKSLVDGIRRASRLYFDERGSWNALVKHIMGIDHSWQRSAGSYLLLYRKLTAPATQAAGDDNG